MAERKVTFTGVDNGVSNLMSRLREDSKQLTNELIRDAQQYSNTSRDQVQYIEEQIKAIERRNRIDAQGQRLIAERQRESGAISQEQYQQQVSQIGVSQRADDLQVALLRELIETIKTTAREEIREDRRDVQDQIREFQRRDAKDDLAGYSEEELFKIRYQQQLLEADEASPGGRGGSVLGGVLGANLINRLGGLVQQIPQAQTQLDLLRPAIGIASAASGAAIGTMADVFTAGQSEFQIIGAELGEQVGQFYAEALMRTLTSREALNVAALRLRAITGRGGEFSGAGALGLPNLGLDRIQEAELAARVANIIGTSRGLAGRTYDFQALQTGFGFDEGTVVRRFALERLGQANTAVEVARIFQIAQQQGFFRGGDQTTFIDLIRNQTALIEQFSQTATMVDPNQATRTLLEFNRIGGMFATADPRSMQLIGGINQALANPQNQFMQAANYQVLRRLDPSASLFDLMRMQEQGLQTPGFLREVIQDVTRMGGGEDFQRLLLSQRLQGIPLDAIDTLFRQRGRLDEISDEELMGVVGDVGAIRRRAAENVTRLTRDRAEITNAFIDGSIEGVTTVAQKFGDEIDRALQSAAERFDQEMENIVAKFGEGMEQSLATGTDPSGIGKTDYISMTFKSLLRQMGYD